VTGPSSAPSSPGPYGPAAAIVARLREDAHNETGWLALYARELLALLDPHPAVPAPPEDPAGPGPGTVRPG
jgi:hypothetical protein